MKWFFTARENALKKVKKLNVAASYFDIKEDLVSNEK